MGFFSLLYIRVRDRDINYNKKFLKVRDIADASYFGFFGLLITLILVAYIIIIKVDFDRVIWRWDDE